MTGTSDATSTGVMKQFCNMIAYNEAPTWVNPQPASPRAFAGGIIHVGALLGLAIIEKILQPSFSGGWVVIEVVLTILLCFGAILILPEVFD
jgi:hypothetical protein